MVGQAVEAVSAETLLADVLPWFVLLDVDGSPPFVQDVQNGMAALATIGLDSYVTSFVNRIDSRLPDSIPASSLAWTDQPADAYARTTVHLKDPYEPWHQPVEVAAYLIHEATHVQRYRVDPATWTDEAAPTSAELLVRWSLLRRQAR